MQKTIKTVRLALLPLMTTVILMLVLSAALPAQASYLDVLFDPFDDIPLRPDPDAYWWVIISEGGGLTEDYCGPVPAACLEEGGAGGTTFARFALFPDESANTYYTNVDVAEKHTGYAYGEPARWSPSPGHPVILRARMRWSEQFNQTGTGGAVGTSGVVLWNSPFDYSTPENPLRDATMIGIMFATDGTAFGQGLLLVVFEHSFPTAVFAPRWPVNMQDWVDFTMLWRETMGGQQLVTFLVNGQPVGAHHLAEPVDSLSIEMWQDNQKFDFTGAIFESPTSDQFYDVDYISVTN